MTARGCQIKTAQMSPCGLLIVVLVLLCANDSFVAAHLQPQLRQPASDNANVAQPYWRPNLASNRDESPPNLLDDNVSNTTSASRKLIYGGKKATDGQFFWFVELVARDRNGTNERRCGATMISQDMVVTAANCLYDITGKLADPDQSRASLMREFTTQVGKGIIRQWKRAIPHEDHYYPSGVDNVGVIQFTEPIFPSQQIPEINKNQDFYVPGYILWAVGAGRTSDQSTLSSKSLLWGEFEVVGEGTNNCRTGNSSIFVCILGRDDKDTDMCRGDEGSALVRSQNLYGIYSHGGTCGNDDEYQEASLPIFLRADFYRDWINLKACGISNARCIGAPCALTSISLFSGASTSTIWQAAKFYVGNAVGSATSWLFPEPSYGKFTDDDDFYSK